MSLKHFLEADNINVQQSHLVGGHNYSAYYRNAIWFPEL